MDELVEKPKGPTPGVATISSLYDLDTALRVALGKEALVDDSAVSDCPTRLRVTDKCLCIKCIHRLKGCGAEALCRKAGCENMYITRCQIRDTEIGEEHNQFTESAEDFIDLQELVDKHILPYSAVPMKLHD